LSLLYTFALILILAALHAKEFQPDAQRINFEYKVF
jgi:hypothetical protein